MSRRLVSLLTIFALLLSSLTMAAADESEEALISDWARPEVERSADAGLMPSRLSAADLRSNVSRLEFAEICLLLYTGMTGYELADPSVQPFNDCTEDAALQAYILGITTGAEGSLADGTLIFGPHRAISRQEAAVMLARTFKKASIPGWSISTDGQYDFNYSMPAPFYDDRYIQPYAYQSIYFMASKAVIKGVQLGGNMHFNPYGLISREQSLIIAVRMLENLTHPNS